MLSGFTSQREIDGTKMKLSKGITLLFLALIFKVALADITGNFTKVYFVELEFEKSVYPNMTALLGKQTEINVKLSTVTEISMTSDCTFNEAQKNCSCMSNYTWSEDICKNHACCKDRPCSLKHEETAVCLSDKRVSINGSTKFNDSYNILYDEKYKGTKEYNNKSKEVTDLLVNEFSKLKYFDSLIINSYSIGSVIVNYTVQLLGAVNSTELEKVIKPLTGSKLITSGIITITVPDNQPIDLGSMAIISCKPSEPLGEVKWLLTNQQNNTTPITKGIEATLTNNNQTITDYVTLSNISESWKGTFTCVYTKNSIEYRASAELDIALLPEIQAMSDPQFPDCRYAKSATECTITCSIQKSIENYNDSWSSDGKSSIKEKKLETNGNILSYKAVVTIDCTEEKVNVNCTFTNSRSKSNKSRTRNVEIPIIKSNSRICQKNGIWPNAKSNYTARLPCEDSTVGLKTRACINEEYKPEVSFCVNKELHVIQHDVQELNKGIGFIKDNAKKIFERIKESTTINTFNSFANINTSINILEVMNDVSQRQENLWNDDVIPDFVNAASNVLNDTQAWKNPENQNTNLSVKYLNTIEGMVSNTNLSSNDSHKFDNVELKLCDGPCNSFNASVSTDSGAVVVGFRNLHKILPKPDLDKINAEPGTTILLINTANTNETKHVEMTFEYSKTRLPNHEMYCVFWDANNSSWSDTGCRWGGATNAESCICDHNSAFTILMSKDEETLPYMDELTYVGLGISIISLVLCLIIEILVWDAVVKSDISNFRHVAVFNIALCLLFAHCGFLVSAEPEKIPAQWCSILTVVKHFFFLAVFFWMLCLSFVILHQIIFVFDHLRKKVFWGLSITLGYVCPILCVAITVITFKNGEADQYYSTKTCWLIYKGTLMGSIYAFILPVGTIVFINLFTLAVVIMKIATPTVSEAKARDEKDVAKSMIKTIIFLSPVLGITWIFGFFVIILDLTLKPWAQVVNYTFTVLNSLQGFFIFLTNCIGEKKVRDALMKRFKGSKQSAHSKSEISTKMTSSVKKK